MSSKQPKLSSEKLRVLIADDHQFVLDRVASALAPHFEIVGRASHGEMLVEEANRLQPDIIVSDILMPGMNGIEAARCLRESGSTAKFIFLSVYDRDDFARACLAEGALGFVSKTRMGTDLVYAVNEVTHGRQFISPTIGEL